MVIATTIIESNTHFASQGHTRLTCVFAGATAGIVFATLERMTTMLQSSTFYILGRSPSRYASKLQQLRELAPSNKIVYVETEVSLIRKVDAACEIIQSAEQKVDCICLSPGGMPFQGDKCAFTFYSSDNDP
jgi:NADP-dependent 3-hydroxy acid dehydrogenase YdfG